MFHPLRLVILLFLAVSIPQIPVQKQQEPQKKPPGGEEALSLETNLVVLNVTVTDSNGRYVGGLKTGDFTVLEDNSPQKIQSFGFEETPFAAAILLDTSGSMERKLALARAACANFVEGIRDGDSFSIYSFGDSRVRKLQDFTEVRDIPDSIWDAVATGNTPLYDAIGQASDALAARPERRRAVLVVSDGADTQSRISLDQAVRKALGSHLLIYAVDMSDASVYGSRPSDSGAEALKSMTARTGGRFFRTPGGSQLREAFSNTVEELRHQYTITYESSNERMDGKWRSIGVRVADSRLSVRTRQGYYAKKR